MLSTGITITSGTTDNASVNTERVISIINGTLTIDTPDNETIRIYNISGTLSFSIIKNEDKAIYNVSNLPDGIYIVTGSKGWSSKVIK